jgi:hypothetical protein
MLRSRTGGQSRHAFGRRWPRRARTGRPSTRTAATATREIRPSTRATTGTSGAIRSSPCSVTRMLRNGSPPSMSRAIAATGASWS